jgi:putative hydrolase of the HAD superfamily
MSELFEMKDNVRIVAFDADDTLWVNEPYYQETEADFAVLMDRFLPSEEVSKELFKTEMQNLSMYGYGAKGFTLSMIETAHRISEGGVSANTIAQIIKMGQALMSRPVELLSGVGDVVDKLSQCYTLVLATKGDLVDQERKLAESGLVGYFHHIEIMSDKKETNYQGLFKQLEVSPESFTMVGNSIRSDIQPVLNLGGYAIHVPYHTTWQHEQVDDSGISNERFYQVEDIRQVTGIL